MKGGNRHIVAVRIEDYALIGNCQTGALVARDGSIDWLCLPRFDSPASFAALLGTPEHGRWQIAPARDAIRASRRDYRPGTLVLEISYETDDGAASVIDCMPIGADTPTIVRIVEGKRGRVAMSLDLVLRLADNLALQGKHDEARAIFERLLDIRNDVGLLSEEYDPEARRLLGNFPQASRTPA